MNNSSLYFPGFNCCPSLSTHLTWIPLNGILPITHSVVLEVPDLVETSNEAWEPAFLWIENGAYLLIDRCNKVILSDIEFQSTAYGDNFYGITCLNENDRTFDLT